MTASSRVGVWLLLVKAWEVCAKHLWLHYSDLSLYNICIPEIYGTKICWLAGARFDFQVHSETTRNRVETSSRIPWFFDPCQCYDNAVYKSGVDLFMLLGTWQSRCAPPFITIPLVIALWVSTCCCTHPFAPKPMTSKFNALLQTMSSSDSEVTSPYL